MKRLHDGAAKGEGVSERSTESPFMDMFEDFRKELDDHHDRRERVIKVSRDITALSKKMIFSLQRVKTLNQEIPAKIVAEFDERSSTILKLFESIGPDLQGLNSWRYQRQITGGIQEYVEAVSFHHYVRNQRLITPEQISEGITRDVNINIDDYILGIFDLVGELMRFAITAMATSGSLPSTQDVNSGQERSVLTDLRLLRTFFEKLDTSASRGNGLGKEIEKKMEVMKTCVEKIENSVYGMIIRGRERPKGWVPDNNVDDRAVGEAF